MDKVASQRAVTAVAAAASNIIAASHKHALAAVGQDVANRRSAGHAADPVRFRPTDVKPTLCNGHR